ncbi:phage/plasmid replication domain-containing protein [Stutzerimonas kunmingensis]|uniref:phage/plasmid replication domain-containing protein n=1 Tax=Stutzerimonas kunmingensis TaxID=1211807 RepID=UPI001C612489|nr:phage/plasmid replication protein [Stutzerimonas kunmingensis]
MDAVEVIARLESEGVVTQTKALYTTATYFQLWRDGKEFDLSKKAVQTHRARLRKIGIDIAVPYSEKREPVDKV